MSILECNNTTSKSQLKKAIQKCNASVAHKSDLLRKLRSEVRELEREITKELAEREYLMLTLKEDNVS